MKNNNNHMRGNSKYMDRSDLYYSENVESMIQMRDNPEESNAAQIERLMQNIRHYKAVSDVVDMTVLKGSPAAEIKRYRESIYWGEITEGKRHGQGIMLYPNGRFYEGFWSGNLRNGKGYERFSNGSTYKGSYINGKPEGCGRYEWQNGQIYEGQWRNGVKNGSGIWRGSKGDSYIGQWQEGKAEGYGVHTWTNGDRYQGQFKNCLKHGEGVERFGNGDTYKGLYECGKPSGYGEYYWASGSYFKGSFKDGLRSGQGVWKKGPGRSDKYEGEWLQDKKEGFGVFTWAEGNIYKGHYINDLRQGFGEMFYIDGSVYRGDWKADQQTEANQPSLEHDEDCQLFMPSKLNVDGELNGDGYQNIHEYYHQGELIPQPMPLYREPQRPAILKSASRNFRPRNFTKNSSRSEKSRLESQGKSRGMVKKMSVGTVAAKPNPYKQGNDLASSFYLYKIHGQDSQKSREHINRRQVRTSGGSRGKQANVDEQLKYFARSKISSYSQLQ